jgi:hypothetical protein
MKYLTWILIAILYIFAISWVFNHANVWLAWIMLTIAVFFIAYKLEKIKIK